VRCLEPTATGKEPGRYAAARRERGCEQLRDQTNGDVRAGTVIEFCGEWAWHHPTTCQRSAGSADRSASPRLEGVAFCLDRQVADNVDVLHHTVSGRSVGWIGAGSVVEPIR
jgi:hypothetical protein